MLNTVGNYGRYGGTALERRKLYETEANFFREPRTASNSNTTYKFSLVLAVGCRNGERAGSAISMPMMEAIYGTVSFTKVRRTQT